MIATYRTVGISDQRCQIRCNLNGNCNAAQYIISGQQCTHYDNSYEGVYTEKKHNYKCMIKYDEDVA